jgi:Flp pilus assembly protein TadG
MTRRSASRSQAMLEFALVLPLLMIIIALVISVSLIYTVRIAEHKAAYDAARHVAKSYKVRVTDKDKNGNVLPGDLISTQCIGQVNFADDPQAAQAVNDQIDYDYSKSGIMRAFASKPEIVAISMGPPLPRQSSPGYYCSQAVSVTLGYELHVPFWNFIGTMFGAQGTGTLREIGISTRLGRDYEVVPPGNDGREE